METGLQCALCTHVFPGSDCEIPAIKVYIEPIVRRTRARGASASCALPYETDGTDCGRHMRETIVSFFRCAPSSALQPGSVFIVAAAPRGSLATSIALFLPLMNGHLRLEGFIPNVDLCQLRMLCIMTRDCASIDVHLCALFSDFYVVVQIRDVFSFSSSLTISVKNVRIYYRFSDSRVYI